MPLAPTDFIFSEDQALILHTASDFARTELLPLDRACDVDESSVATILPKLSEIGFLNLLVPEELGGVGCPYRTFAAIIHELSTQAPSVGVTVAVHSLVGGIVNRFVREPLRSRWLSAWGRPDNFAAFSVSEAGAGSDIRSGRTSARRVDDGFRINGEKMWVTNGMSARWLFTLVRLQGIADNNNFCTLMVDANQPAVTRTKIQGKMGIRGSETAVVHFADAFVPEENLVGAVGEGLKICSSSLHGGRIGIAAQATGIGEACLTEMVAYAKQREQFGRPIASFQAIGEMIADSAVELEAAKALVWRAACAVDAGETNRIASSMAKLYASEAANRIAYRAVQVHGGAGYVRECRVEQLYRDARITSIYEGTSEIQRIVIARELAKS